MPVKATDKIRASEEMKPFEWDMPDEREGDDPPAVTDAVKVRRPIRITGPDLRDSRSSTVDPPASTVPAGGSALMSSLLKTMTDMKVGGEDEQEPKTSEKAAAETPESPEAPKCENSSQ